MKNKALYDKTVNILVQAYFNDTLEHGNCCACAVGNMVADACGLKFRNNRAMPSKEWVTGDPMWQNVFCTDNDAKVQKLAPWYYDREARKQIDSTGYAWEELAKIEYAFEMAPKGKSSDQYMFNGLMSVIEVLDQIHENTDQEVTASSKQMFVRA